MRGLLVMTVLFVSALPAVLALAQTRKDYDIMRDDYSIMVPEKEPSRKCQNPGWPRNISRRAAP